MNLSKDVDCYMNKGKLIGKGMTAEVFEWGKDKVLKLYFERYNDARVKSDAKIEYEVHQTGVASPEVFDVINLDNRIGIIYQRIYGKTIIKQMETEPWRLTSLASKTAELHFKIHNFSSNDLPTQKERLKTAIKDSSLLLGDKVKKILHYVDSLPGGSSLCHGDFHFSNIMVSDNNLVAIDWTHAYKGNPMGDIARTCLMINSPFIPPGAPNIMIMLSYPSRCLALWTYLNEYMKLSKIKLENIDAWTLPVAAARLREKIPGEDTWLMKIINSYIEQIKT
jgi:uncharacterized protein (TIGR02172 family)